MWSSKVSCSLLVHLAILLGLLLVRSGEGQSREAFVWKHIDYPKSYPTSHPDTYCTLMMMQRGMTRYVCKETSTFINDFPISVVQVCRGRGTPSSNYFDSTDTFDMVLCRYTGGPPPYNCRYSGKPAHLRIRVTCTGNHPTHYVTQRT
ncbi:ribonuclease pancreatic-like [Podarcis raffonei]|uniref:ribonuclease pancreatic-like n=1 Tax=Podarcis raffonei TaxID=65483 RepID=UPI0023294512|nr:ribonuclease pancreatic-like [Podarcis raffonei]